MIVRARTVVTMDGPPIENGAVAVSGNRIVDVGRFDDIKTRNAGNTLDLGEQVLLPGLINAHCHLDYTCLRGKIPPQKSFTEWIRAINAEKATLAPKDYIASINEGFAEAKRFGTTTIANLTAFPELIPQIQPPVRTCWFAELIDIRAPERANELVDAAIESLGRARPELVLSEAEGGAPLGLAPHALFTASKDLFRRCGEIAQREHILLTTHLAESREEMEMFRHALGPLYEFIKSIGRPMNDCGSTTPLEGFLNLIGRGGSPNRLRSLGFNVCLGTDSLASNESLSLFAEMCAFQKEFPSVSAEEIFQMATVNPARALRQENALGQIRPGFGADLITVPCSGSTNVFEQIIAFGGRVPWVMVSGKT